MLVLSRRENEEVVLQLPDGGEVVIQVARLRGEIVRLGFEAPRGVRIWRRELLPEPAESKE